jgi:hypothetical protein
VPDGAGLFKNDTGLHYLKHAARRAGVAVDALVAAAKVQRCAACGSGYLDPWLSPETASFVFVEATPDHIAGWALFERWLGSASPSDTESANARLWAEISRRAGRVESYAEFGCPFQGLLLHFAGAEKDLSRRAADFAAALDREPDARWTGATRLHRALGRVADAAAVAYHRARGLRSRLRGESVPASAAPPPPRRYLLTQDTVRAWGGDCTRYGHSCRYFGAKTLGATVLPFSADGLPEGSLDLLGVFNFLDHTGDPLAVLRRGLALARRVAVVTHHASMAGKQHLYAFGEDFPLWLRRVLPEAEVEDLTAALNAPGRRDNNYILLTRRHGR